MLKRKTHLICFNHLLLENPFERYNANVCFALAFCFVFSCHASLFLFLSCNPTFVHVRIFLLHACHCLHLALIAHKKTHTNRTNKTNNQT